MASEQADEKQKTDVLILEDESGEVPKIVKWLDLNRFHWKESRLFLDPPPKGLSPEVDPDGAWNRITREIRQVDPKVVIFDYLLALRRKSDDSVVSFNGLAFACESKGEWPRLGVIVLTTGGSGEMGGAVTSQEELDEQHRRNKWPIEHAWIKGWMPGKHPPSEHYVREEIDWLLNYDEMEELHNDNRERRRIRPLRPSEHPKYGSGSS